MLTSKFSLNTNKTQFAQLLSLLKAKVTRLKRVNGYLAMAIVLDGQKHIIGAIDYRHAVERIESLV